MKKWISALGVLALSMNMGNLNHVLKNNIYNNTFFKQLVKNDISLDKLNKRGNFYFFNNNFGLVINDHQLWFLNKNKSFQEIANPNNIKFIEFINGNGGNYGILKAENKDLYLLTNNGKLTNLAINDGKVTIISNTKFLVQTKEENKTKIYLGKIKKSELISLATIALPDEINSIEKIQYIRDDEVIIKANDTDYNFLVNKSQEILTKLSWKAQYFFYSNRTNWVIKNDDHKVLLYNYITNQTEKEFNFSATDIIPLNSNTYLLKKDNDHIMIINKAGQVINKNYEFKLDKDYNLININRYFLLLFDPINNKTKIIQRKLNTEKKLNTREIELGDEIQAIKLLNTKVVKDKKKKIEYYYATFFLKKLNNEKNCILTINGTNSINDLKFNINTIPNKMNGEINSYNKTISIFREYETNELYWYQVY